ncbi:FdhF/YdeP family oxidoreductase [Acidiferrobacter thiooxydans]|jgi:formate dehydrogenase major subunit|uniref:FdhF/YdeP family oxidoreductase n=1 Tax=Acidiferrobacter thiooxydans TaxID=163359 RepID=UPI0008251C8D|nr:FdhF/YdeP family oxidoreductase [Acidiferrobacter thiooxydans]UEO00822.1 FdhF/YdeP family oxidoreductase [Acidiferrobacter thiooxydans]
MSTVKFRPYQQAAGGWGALRSSLHSLQHQGILADGTALLLKSNQAEGFDCPGCAWPDPDAHSTFEFCENGVKAVAAEATSKRVTAAFFAEHPVSWLAEHDDYFLEDQGRLTEPMAYDAAGDRYVPISWEAAFRRIADHLRALKSPDEAIFYTSGRTSNEAAFLYQLFVREFGTNNLPDCSNMCHEPTSIGMPESIGIGKGTVTLEDFDHADTLLLFGHNPGTNHPRMLGTLRDAARRGCRILAFNPLKERGLERFVHPQHAGELLSRHGTDIATHYYQPRIGGDYAIALGIARYVLESGTPDRDFIAAHTQGFDAFKTLALGTPWETIETESGLRRADLEEVGRIYDEGRAAIITWGMGITQHKHAVATVQMLVNVLLLKGNIGKPGAGPAPIRGHSNVQGDRTMGIWERPPADFLERLGREFDFEPPRAPGYDVIGSIKAMEEGRAPVFFAMGGNFANASPDTARVHAALRRCRLTVHVATKLNRSHVVHGQDALILPCLGRTEIDIQDGRPQGVTVEDSMSMVHISQGMRPPASAHLKSECAIVAGLAEATLPKSRTPWRELVADYDRIRDRIARVVAGFEDFNARVHKPRGFHLDLPPRARKWTTPSGKAHFIAQDLSTLVADRYRPQTAERVFNLMTIRSHDQYNTTIYGLEDRYRGVSGARNVCFIHPDDLSDLGFNPEAHVDIVSHWSDGKRVAHDFVLVPYDIPRGCLAGYYPELNILVPLSSHADRANTPTSKSVSVTLHPATARG